MLHIVNGDSVGDKLKRGNIQGDILVWREIYPVGPVYGEMADSRNRLKRAQYLEAKLGIPQADFLQISESQLTSLEAFRKYNEVVLWFEHDLFDQTMLCHLLHWFSGQPLGSTKLSLLCIGSFPGIDLFRGLGQLTPAQLETLSGTWQLVGRRELELGRKAWEAYTSPEPEKHAELIQEDTRVLPYIREAFEAHLSRMPSTRNGLGVIEQTTLELVENGIHNPYELFTQARDKLNVLGMGDLEYWYRLSKLSEGTFPLLRIEGAAEYPKFNSSDPLFRQCTITLTGLGEKVLAGKEDWLLLQGIDEWYGGIHLQGRAVPWRWDELRKTIIPCRL